MQSIDLHTHAPHLDTNWREQYVRSLSRWFAKHQRDLPWRKTTDPYAIWVSETMLQQTQVATVIDYYHRFLGRFPNVQSLAEANEQEVLQYWAGLGYYRRARQMHAAARKVVEDFKGKFPADVDGLLALPGIGRYTAGAVASIASNIEAPILEANTERLFARLISLRQPVREPNSQKLLWSFAQWHLSPTKSKVGPRVLNQAAMELGALICKPVNPLCDQCPLTKLCPTYHAGLQSSIPVPKEKKVFTDLHHMAFLIRDNHRWLFRKNPEGAWWTGLWDVPRIDVTDLELVLLTQKHDRWQKVPDGWSNKISQRAEERLGIAPYIDESDLVQPALRIRHGVTRYRILLDCLIAQPAWLASSKRSRSKMDSMMDSATWQWCTPEEALQLPLTSTAKKIVKHLGATKELKEHKSK